MLLIADTWLLICCFEAREEPPLATLMSPEPINSVFLRLAPKLLGSCPPLKSYYRVDKDCLGVLKLVWALFTDEGYSSELLLLAGKVGETPSSSFF